jgi:hypothetical protein
MTVSEIAPARPPTRQLLKYGVLVIVLAVVVNLLVAGVADGLADTALMIPSGPGEDDASSLTTGHIVVSTVVGGVLGMVALVTARRFLRARADVAFAVAAAFFAVATIATSATSSIPASSKATLATLHVTAALVLIPGLLAIGRIRR